MMRGLLEIQARTFAAGVLAGFLACVTAGWYSTRLNTLPGIVRFHSRLGPETLFYPTSSQVRQLVLARVQPDRVGVVIGGSSVMHGTGQPPERPWHFDLQERLGSRFTVLNLALRGGLPQEFGNLVVESLLEERKLIFLSDVHPCLLMLDNAAGYIHTYFFWDAYFKGMLRSWPERDAAIQRVLAGRDEKFRESVRRARWNHLLYYDDLWNTVGYWAVFTAFAPLTYQSPLRPRRLAPDFPAATLPIPDRYNLYNLDREMTHLRRLVKGCTAEQLGKGAGYVSADVHPRVRERMVLVQPAESPYYRSRLTGEETRGYLSSFTSTTERLSALGIQDVVVGFDFTEEDYLDRPHLMASGGRKMAAAVAPVVQRKARELYPEMFR